MKAITTIVLFVLVCSLSAAGSRARAASLDEIAGIAAKAQLSILDLSKAENAFRIVETREGTTLTGRVALDGYDASHDVHVYVTGTGRIIAYYLKDEPASKIVDWVGYAGGDMPLKGSKLEDAMLKVCRAVGQELPSITYFDFRYPGANTIKILADKQTLVAHKKLKYTSPAAGKILNASWSSAVHVDTAPVADDSVLCLDGKEVYRHSQPPVGWQIANADMDMSIFSEQTAHEMDIYNVHRNHRSYAAIVLVCNK